MSENDPIKMTPMSFTDKPKSFAEVPAETASRGYSLGEAFVPTVPADDPTGELTEVELVPVDEDEPVDDSGHAWDLEAAWAAEQGHRDEQDAKFRDILNAHHVAEDHAPGDRQHHGHWGPHTH